MIVATSSSVPCSSATANACLSRVDRPVGPAEQELEPAEVVEQPADVAAVAQLLVRRLRLLRVRPRQHPVPVALGDQRGLEVRVARGAHVVHRLRELERELDVLARRLVVALPPVAARAPRVDARPEEVGRDLRPVEQLQRLSEERDGGRDAREQVAADAEPEEHLGAVDVREFGSLRERARLGEQVEPGSHLAVVHPRPGLAREQPHPQLRRAAGHHRPERRGVLVDRAVEVEPFGQRLRPREHRLGAGALVARDAAREERGVDAEARREPGDRLRRSGASCPARSGRRTPSRTGGPPARTASFPQQRAAGAAAHPGASRGGSFGCGKRRSPSGSGSVLHRLVQRNPLEWTVVSQVTSEVTRSLHSFWMTRLSLVSGLLTRYWVKSLVLVILDPIT